jgi:antitoxin YefM
MTMILVMAAVFSLSHIKSHLSDVVDTVEKEHERVVLTRNGRPAAVLVSPDDLAALEDTLDLLSDPAAMEQIHQAEDEISQGQGISGEELRAKYLGT